MTIKEQIKIFDGKIKRNQAGYDLHRQNAKISALSSGKLDKHEYLTGEDLGYRPDPVQKAKFEYSPLGQVFNKGLNADEKQEGLLKRLKNIEDTTDRQLEENKNNKLGVKSIVYAVKEELSQEAKNILEKLNNQEKLINYKKLSFRGVNNKDYDFTNFSSLRELFNAIYYGKILIPGAEREQNEFDDMTDILKTYRPRKDSKYYKLKQDLLINEQNFYDGREMIVNTFKNKIFPLKYPARFPECGSEKDTLSRRSISSDSEDELSKLYEAIPNVGNKLDSELIKKYFNKGPPLKLFNFLRYSQSKFIAGTKQSLIEARLFDLKKDIRNMSDGEIINKNLYLIPNIVKKIIDTVKKINNQEEQPDIKGMPPLESGRSCKITTKKTRIKNNETKANDC